VRDGGNVPGPLEGFAEGNSSLRVTGAALLSSLAMSLIVHFGIVPHTALGDRLSVYSALWPQGWRFFVGLDSVDSVVIYRPSMYGGNLSMALRPADARKWGLSRVADAEFIIGSRIAGTVPDSYWQTCDKPVVADCSSTVNSSLVFDVEDASVPEIWCGLAVIVVERPKVNSTRKIALVNLPCAA
jgi:hypothetical protein